ADGAEVSVVMLEIVSIRPRGADQKGRKEDAEEPLQRSRHEGPREKGRNRTPFRRRIVAAAMYRRNRNCRSLSPFLFFSSPRLTPFPPASFPASRAPA